MTEAKSQQPFRMVLEPTATIPENASSLSEVAVDPIQFQKEETALNDRIRNLSLRCVGKINLSKESLCEYNRLLEKRQLLVDAIVSLRGAIIDHPKGKTMDASLFFRTINMAAVFLLNEVIQKQRKFMDFHDFPSPHIELAHLTSLKEDLPSQETNIKIGGLSIKDVVRGNSKFTLGSAFKFVQEANLGFHRKEHEKIVSENNDETSPISSYPMLLRKVILDASADIQALFEISVESLEKNIQIFCPETTGMKWEIIKKAKDLVGKTSQLRRGFLATICNPKSPSFPELRDAVASALQEKDDFLTIVTLVSLGINNRGNLVTSYRHAKQLAQANDENSSFYKLFTLGLERLVDEMPSDYNILTPDDLPASLPKDKTPAQEGPLPGFDELRKIIKDIQQNKHGDSYLLDQIHIKNVNWGILSTPVSLEVVLPRKNVSTVGLVFNFKEGDLNVEFIFIANCDKKEISWSFLDSPDDPEMKTLKDAFLALTHSLLLNLQQYLATKSSENPLEMPTKTAEDILEAVQKDRDSQKPPAPTRLVPEQPKRRNQKWKAVSAKIPEDDTINSLSRERVKQAILPPDQDLIGSLPQGVQLNIRSRIDLFNQKGIGRIKPIIDETTKDGRKLYGLKALRTFRILIARVPSEKKGVDTFEVIRIGHRKDIFNKEKESWSH